MYLGIGQRQQHPDVRQQMFKRRYDRCTWRHAFHFEFQVLLLELAFEGTQCLLQSGAGQNADARTVRKGQANQSGPTFGWLVEDYGQAALAAWAGMFLDDRAADQRDKHRSADLPHKLPCGITQRYGQTRFVATQIAEAAFALNDFVRR